MLRYMPAWFAYIGKTPSTEVIVWCDKTFDAGSWWYEGRRRFGFVNEQYHSMFILKWS